jgi:dipeptidyl aminopeptidase/acylaminoacyl peptidase
MARPITPEDLWALDRVAAPSVSPDGRFAVVSVTSYDIDDNVGRGRLVRVQRDGSTTRLTGGESSDTSPVVCPHGTRVAFLRRASDEDAKPQLHVMHLDGGEAIALTDLPLGAGAPRWTPEGDSFVFPVPLLAGHESIDATRTEVEARTDRKVEARVTEDRVYRYWNRWLADGEIHHLFRIDADGSGLTDLMPEWTRPIDLDDPGGSFDTGPDGEVAFHAFSAEAPYDEIGYGVYVIPAGGAPEPIWPDGPSLQVEPRYSSDGTTIAFGFATEFPGYYADRLRLTLFDRTTRKRTVLTEDWDYSCEEWSWRPDGSGLVFAAEQDARQHLFSIDVGGGEPARLAKGGWITNPTPTRDGEVWCLHQSLSHPADVAIVSAGTADRIGGFNTELLDEWQFGRVDDVRFAGAHGDEIQMFVVLPPGYEDGTRYPLVHSIHGGPHGTFGDLWHYRWNPQAFAAPGYVVAMVNFHGSTGRGTEFGRSIQGAWGGMPTEDIEAATDHLIAEGLVDPERMALAGGSYGGYMVAWMIGHSDRYRTAICHAGVTNLLGQWATDVTHGRGVSFGGLPWDGLDNIVAWSPTSHLAEATTPTLVVHGEQDYRVVVTQGLELYGILKAKGVDTRLVYYPDEGHWILKPQNSLHWYGEFLGWLERRLGG